LLRAAGHKVNYQSAKEKKWKKALKKSSDIVVVAGGDGTVAKVAKQLVGSRTPITVLPTGTANNIAKTLGLTELKLKELIAGWKHGRCVHFDVGVASGPWGSKCFVEGFGLGLFAEAMLQLDGKENGDLAQTGKPAHVIDSVLRILKKKAQHVKPKKISVRLDGKDLSGEYILLEALNIRYIGPNLDLVPQADASDGFLDVVMVTPGGRPKLSSHLSDLLKGKGTRPKLKFRRGKQLQIEWESSPVHIDDMPWPHKDDEPVIKSNAIDVKVQPGALVFLIPKTRRRAR
jgi:diacylglycerol kinase family enzyme